MELCQIVGGSFTTENKISTHDGITSFLKNQLSKIIPVNSFINGGEPSELPRTLKHELSIWMPYMYNYDVFFPLLNKNGTTIVSKVIKNNKIEEATERLILTGADAIIAITFCDGTPSFKLLDKYNNVWISTKKITDLVLCIVRFFAWNSYNVKRKNVLTYTNYKIDSYEKSTISIFGSSLKGLDIAHEATYSAAIRCSFLTPNSFKAYKFAHISKNMLPRPVKVEDFTLTNLSTAGSILYRGNYVHYPSNSASLFLDIFTCSNLNYIIKLNCNVTKQPWISVYYPDGDNRESIEIITQIKNSQSGIINLTNKGCLIYGTTIHDIREILKNNVLNLRPHMGTVY